jgi:hypothetical protein
MIKSTELSKATHLVERRRKLVQCLGLLNEINGGMKDWAIPTSVVDLIDDRESLVKGLISLVVPEISDVERQITDLGVSL